MWLNLQIFGFKALWSPYFFSFLLIVALVYYLVTGPFRYKFNVEEKPDAFMQAMFYLGLLLLYILKGSPIDLLSHIMFSAHMLQSAFLYFVFPILIIKGIPTWIWKRIINLKFFNPIFVFFTKPLIALLLFSSLLALYHMPAVFDFSKSNIIVHGSVTVILVITAFFMWWNIIPPLTDYIHLTAMLKIFYLMGSAAIITVACALIIFASTPMYLAYSAEGTWIQAMSLCVPGDVLSGLEGTISGPEMFSPLSTIHDQQLGGAVMMVVQQVIYVLILGVIFYTEWFTRDQLKIDPLPSNRF